MQAKSSVKNLRPARIFLLHGLAALLATSLIWPPGAAIWRALSTASFYGLNGSLLWGQPWALFWALVNTKTFDTIGALLLLIPLLWYLYDEPRTGRIDRLSRVTLLLVAVALMTGISKLLLPEIHYPSPSLVLEPFQSLRVLVPDITSKVESIRSFPGDHAVFVFTYMAICFSLIGGKYALLGLFFAALYVLPRLVSGAHWLSDDIVGGGIAALIAFGWAIHSPGLFWFQKTWTRLANWTLFKSLFKLFRLPE